jgi:anti-sigma B factor antagonist
MDHLGNTAANGFAAESFDGLLWLHVSAGNGAVVVECRGELDLSNAQQLRDALPVADAQGISLLRIDLAGVTFMDSSGLASLLEADRRCHELGATLEIVASRFIARLFALTGNPIPHLDPSQHGRPTSATDRLARSS